MTRALLCLTALLAPLAWGVPEEAQLEEKLAAESTAFLDSLLGQGRAKVLVTLEAEQSQIQTHTEINTPITYVRPGENKSLPGYADTGDEVKKRWEHTQKEQEASTRSSLVIKKLRVSVVLDDSLTEAQVNAVRRLLPEFLHMSGDRGDELSVLRADLAGPLRSALASPEGVRLAAVFAGAAGLILLMSLLAYRGAMRLLRVFVAEAAAARSLGGGAPMPSGLPGGGPLGPELLPGGLPSLTDEEEPVTGEARPLALGRRFDFLSAREPAEVAQLISSETPQDVALLFAYLADSNPDLATAIFSALSQRAQSAVSQALAGLSMADPERLAMLENRLKNLVEFGVRGPERLGKILSRLPPAEREGLIGDLMTSSPRAAEEVGKALFTFEDIVSLKPQELRRLIMGVTYTDWGLALRGAPPELTDKVLEQLLPGTRNLIQEEMENPQPRNKVLEARSKILSQAFAMAGRGELSLGREGAATELI